MTDIDITVPTVGYTYRSTNGHTGQAAWRWLYRAADPLAVGLVSEGTPWWFARDLLVAGLAGVAGVGDVRIFPGVASHCAHIGVTLQSPKGLMATWFPRERAEQFLARTCRLVPRGGEDVSASVDAAIARLRPKGWVS